MIFIPPDNLKNQLIKQILRTIDSRRLTQSEVAAILGISQSEFSKLKRGPHNRFRIERLFHFLNLLNINVDVYVTKAKEDSHQQVVAI